LRVAVPDGLHPDPAYVDTVKAGAGTAVPTSGLDGNAANHKALYTYRTLRQLFESAGFRVIMYEYFDEFPLPGLGREGRHHLAVQAL
jgi:predicted SAM-dependent methyltransferase